MKSGRTLTELAAELTRQLESKKDYIADTRAMTMTPRGNLLVSGLEPFGFAVTQLAHDQIATRLGIPKVYYERMKNEAPDLLSSNVGHWFMQKPENRMLRVMDGRLRAFLSDKYRPLDNYDLAEVVLPVITELGCRIESCELTDRKLYIKAVNERITTDVTPGDTVQAGIVVSNSEVGCGSVRVEPLVYRLVCKNGLIANDFSMRKYHVGRGNKELAEDDVTQFFKDETRVADDKAFWMKVRDIVQGSLTEAIFTQIVRRMRLAKDIPVIDPVKAVELVAKKHTLAQDEQTSVLKFLVQGGDLSLYGMLNAVTRASQDVPDYDRATELERIGGIMLQEVGVSN